MYESKNSPQKFSKLGDKIPETQNEADVQISIKSEIDTQSGENFSKRVTDPCGSHKTEFKDELCLSILAVNTDAHIHSSQSINPKISRVSDDRVHHIQAKISSNGGLFLSSDTDRNHIYLEKNVASRQDQTVDSSHSISSVQKGKMGQKNVGIKSKAIAGRSGQGISKRAKKVKAKTPTKLWELGIKNLGSKSDFPRSPSRNGIKSQEPDSEVQFGRITQVESIKIQTPEEDCCGPEPRRFESLDSGNSHKNRN